MLHTMHHDRDWPTALRIADDLAHKVAMQLYAAIEEATGSGVTQVDQHTTVVRTHPDSTRDECMTDYEIKLWITDIEPEEPRKQRAVLATVFRQIADAIERQP